jgi:hypothetical protein
MNTSSITTPISPITANEIPAITAVFAAPAEPRALSLSLLFLWNASEAVIPSDKLNGIVAWTEFDGLD